MPVGSVSLYRSLVAILVAGFVAVGLMILVSSRIEASAAAPQVVCDASTAVYGEAVTCRGEGGEALLWPDGVRTGVVSAHSPAFVGDGQIALLGESGAVVDEVTLRVAPDLTLSCLDRDDTLRKVFKLEHTDLRSSGWDYVFVDSESSEEIRPGHSAHPNGGSEEGLERVVLDEVRSTGLCRVESKAGDDLGGDYTLTVESPWEASQTTSLRIIGPSSKTQWAGTQAAELVGTVTVNNVTASERTRVYQSGCS